MNYVPPELLDGSTKVIDLSADYRLDIPVFEKIYGIKHSDPRNAVYGLVELHPEAAREYFVANPGCFPTGAILSAAPPLAAAADRYRGIRLQNRDFRGQEFLQLKPRITRILQKILSRINLQLTGTGLRSYRN